MPTKATNEIVRKDILFSGKLILADDSMLIGESNFQSLKNIRYYGQRLRGVLGMTKINATAIPTYPKVRSGFHFVKHQPAESHILVQAYDSGETNARVLDNVTAVPNAGNFAGTSLFTPSTGFGNGRWGKAPQGNIAYCNGVDACIWGGEKNRIAGFLNEDGQDTTFFWDYTEQLQNSLTDSLNIAALNNGTEATPLCTFYVGVTRPLGGTYSDGAKRGIYFNIGTANTAVATLTGYYWSGSAWVSLAVAHNASDGTASGGVTLAQDGWFSFDSTANDAKPSMQREVMLYWYKFVSSTTLTGSPTLVQVQSYSPFQKIRDLWDGELRSISSCLWWSTAVTKYRDRTINILKDEFNYTGGTPDSSSYFDIATLAANDYMLFGFTERLSGIEFHLQSGNDTTSTMTISYWDGNSWVSVGTLSDGTYQNSKTLNQSGAVTWNPPEISSEFKTTVNGSIPMYYYKMTLSADPTGSIDCYYIAGIPAPKNIRSYKFPFFADNALWLCNNMDDKKNVVFRSGTYAPDVWNGKDSVEIEIGDETELTTAISLYSRLANSIYDVKLFFKSHSMYGMTGFTPEDYSKPYTISPNIGCVAPETLKNVVIYTENGFIPVIIWQAADGIYIFDNSVPIKVSRDIDNFFNKNESTIRRLKESTVNESYAFVDFEKMEYHWIFTDGANALREFVLDLLSLRWFEISRGTGKELRCGVSVTDTDANVYTYGFIDTGYMERLEYGDTFDGTNIAYEVWTGDYVPSGSFLLQSQLTVHKLMTRAKSGYTDAITITHYGDGQETGLSLANASFSDSGYRVKHNRELVNYLDYYTFHSFKYNCTLTTNANWGQFDWGNISWGGQNIPFEPMLAATEFLTRGDVF